MTPIINGPQHSTGLGKLLSVGAVAECQGMKLRSRLDTRVRDKPCAC